jgi:hypothetical protein
VELASRWPDVRVWRCSHTGGHRFAPTAITGRAWAFVDAPLLEGVLRRRADLTELAPHDRGTTGLGMWAQVVERALFEHHGWAWLDHDVTSCTTAVDDDGQHAEVALEWRAPDGSTSGAVGQVEITRVLPVLVCGEPPERAKKTSPELRLTRLDLGTGPAR